MINKNVCCLLCCTIGFMACKTDSPYRSKLDGRWSLTYGELNGREAPSLERIFFEFRNDTIKTNFTISEQEETATFKISDNALIQNTGEPIEYGIETLNDSVLEMTTALRGLDFKLVLKKE